MRSGWADAAAREGRGRGGSGELTTYRLGEGADGRGADEGRGTWRSPAARACWSRPWRGSKSGSARRRAGGGAAAASASSSLSDVAQQHKTPDLSLIKRRRT